MLMTEDLTKAIQDVRYLLSRGYNRVVTIRFVADSRRVTLSERYVLIRGVYDETEAEKRRKKLVKTRSIADQIVSVDGYNLLITVESMLAGKLLIQCDDSTTRDISAVFGKHKITKRTFQALQMILQIFKENNPKEVRFYYDKQVSKSGQLASVTRRMLEEVGLKGTAATAQKSDMATLKSGGIIVSSDSVVVQKAENVLDLAGELAERASYKNMIKLPR